MKHLREKVFPVDAIPKRLRRRNELLSHQLHPFFYFWQYTSEELQLTASVRQTAVDNTDARATQFLSRPAELASRHVSAPLLLIYVALPLLLKQLEDVEVIPQFRV